MRRTHCNDNKDLWYGEPTNAVGNQRVTYKPDGLWYELNDSWKDWVSHEMPKWMETRFTREHEISIDMTDVLVLDTVEKMLAFTREYGVNKGTFANQTLIDWYAVARKHTGIEIPIYQWSLRRSEDTPWYYPWDVASGCIWDPEVITIIESRDIGDKWRELARKHEWPEYY